MDISGLKDRLERELERFYEIEDLLANPEVASDPVQLKKYSREHTLMTPGVVAIKEYLSMLKTLEETTQLIQQEKDPQMLEMAKEEMEQAKEGLEAKRSKIEMLLIPPDPNSGKSIIMEIRAGTGGEEAALFVGDLYRMYSRFCEKNALRLEVISLSETGIGGYKEVVLAVSGNEAYDLLHNEGGGHRVQRIPVTESGGRIHTSAVTVAVMTEAHEEEIHIQESDLEIDTYRASGAGGQHVNKTDSAIRITHIPSGIVVQCQDERSQMKNKVKAMRVLRTRLAEQQQQKAHAESSAAKKQQIGSGDRSERVRTYNFPQGRLTDHRIAYTSHNLTALMDGEIRDLLTKLLLAERNEKIKNSR